MPCLSLKHKKIYRSTVYLPFLRQKLADLTAQSNDSSQLILESKSLKKSLKNQHKLARKIAMLEAKIQSLKTQSIVVPEVKSKSKPILLKDGVSVQIRPHRTPHYVSTPELVYFPNSPFEGRFLPEKSTEPILKPRFFRRHYSRAELINAESFLGGQIFGPVPEGHRREFFHDQDGVWIWYEDLAGNSEDVERQIVRYEVRPSGVYKKLSAGRYIRLDGWELDNFLAATRLYLQTIKQNLYHLA